MLLLLILIGALPVVFRAAQDEGPHRPPWAPAEIASSHPLKLGTSILQIDFAPGPLDLPVETVLAHFQSAAEAVTAYYGRFPVGRARILLIPVPDRSGIMQGTTWGNVGGLQGFTRMRVGQHTTAQGLREDWMATHEMVHLGFPSLPDDQHWMEEGLATYVEPIARVATGDLDSRSVWHDMMRDMPKGEPGPGDEGIDRTHTWGRTYWGGALFCLVADVAIRRQTGNRKSLQDALRAIVAGGGSIDHDWPLDKALTIGDRATGTRVLSTMYAQWKDKPVTVDLSALWSELGVRSNADGAVEFVSSAPLAKIREAIAGEHAPSPPRSTSGTN